MDNRQKIEMKPVTRYQIRDSEHYDGWKNICILVYGDGDEGVNRTIDDLTDFLRTQGQVMPCKPLKRGYAFSQLNRTSLPYVFSSYDVNARNLNMGQSRTAPLKEDEGLAKLFEDENAIAGYINEVMNASSQSV